MKVTTAAEMGQIDRLTAEKFGVHSLSLMENAGTAVANFAREYWPNANRMTVVCGRGNNGGDGFVAARKLHTIGKVVEVVLLGDPEGIKADAANMFARLPFRPIVVHNSAEMAKEKSRSIANSDLIIDAILGTGARLPVEGLAAEAIAAINATSVPVLSVDLPSGADADSSQSHVENRSFVCRSDAIVTFTAPKPVQVHQDLTRGPIVVAHIGSPEEAIVSKLQLSAVTPHEVSALFAPRALDNNKGRLGHVLIVGGSLGKSGAPSMSALAALRTGAGLVTVATPISVLPMVASFAAEIMTEPLGDPSATSLQPSDAQRCLQLAETRTVLAIGPGLSRESGVKEFVHTLVRSAKIPVVLDADGLNAFTGEADKLDGLGRVLVLTPHPGEMARLVGKSVPDVQKDRVGVARTFARDHHCIVVLKGFRTVIAYPSGDAWMNLTGNPGLATGGTGDILTGMVAAAIGQFPTRAEEAVRAAVFLHGLAGDMARNDMEEEPMIATDLARSMPAAFREMRRRASQAGVRLC